MDRLLVVRLGLIPYEEGVRVQAGVERRRLAGEIPDVVLMLEFKVMVVVPSVA